MAARAVRIPDSKDPDPKGRGMNRRAYLATLVLVGFVLGLAVSGRLIIHAQDRPGAAARVGGDDGIETTRPGPKSDGAPAAGRAASVQDVLLRPFRFDFDRATPLSEVCVRLRRSLGVSVVLDLAALERQEIEPKDTVQLELDGARLKTGLKLLLDQVKLTYRVVPEDNLLIITDKEGSDDPLDRIWSELRTLHRDLHDVQDAVDELTDSILVEEEGPRMRKPTIIEEKPEAPAGDEGPFPGQPAERSRRPETRPRTTPGTSPSPDDAPAATPAPRTTPGRVPLSNRRRTL